MLRKPLTPPREILVVIDDKEIVVVTTYTPETYSDLLSLEQWILHNAAEKSFRTDAQLSVCRDGVDHG